MSDARAVIDPNVAANQIEQLGRLLGGPIRFLLAIGDLSLAYEVFPNVRDKDRTKLWGLSMSVLRINPYLHDAVSTNGALQPEHGILSLVASKSRENQY